MSTALLEMEGTWREIASKIPDFADKRLHVVVQSADEPKKLTTRDSRPLVEILTEIASRTDPAEVAKLPTDLTSQLDHYIYGTPKR